MESRIILSRADFSANNIGRYVELSELTKKVLAKQTQYDEQSVEAAALNTFLANLTEDGFIGGNSPLLTTLVIPALAGQYSEIFYNIAHLDIDGYPTDEMNTDEKSAESKGFAFVTDANNRKVAVKRTTTFNPGTTAALKDRVSIDSHLFETLNVEYPSFTVIAYGNGGINQTYSSSRMLLQRSPNYLASISTDGCNMSYESNAFVKNLISGALSGSGFYGLSYVKKETWEGIVAGGAGTIGEVQTTGDLSVLNTQSGSNLFMLGTYYVDDDRHFQFGAIAFGNYINPTQMATLKGYFDTLMTALHVNTNA